MNARRRVALGVLLLFAVRADAQTIRLRGTVVSPSTVAENQVVTIQGTTIASVAAAGGRDQSIAVDGVIFPGLIDLHDHLTWNVMPNWQPPRVFTNRYEWQDTAGYQASLNGPYYWLRDAYPDADCDMNLFGEIKALVNGATATVGSLSPDRKNGCINGLVRNLDFASGLYGNDVNKEPFRNLVFPLEPRYSTDPKAPADEEADIRSVNRSSASGVRAVVMHLGEGTDAMAAREFRQAKALRYFHEGVSVIHGVALNAAQFGELAKAKVGFIWSPHSNFILYGKTAEIRTAVGLEMKIALAPDWSPSGSAGMLEELQFAHRFAVSNAKEITDAALVKMATSTPAYLAAIDTQVGAIEAGKLADLVVMRPGGASAYEALMGGVLGVRLVMIAGVARYGDPELMKALAPSANLQAITICGQPRLLNLDERSGSPKVFSQLLSRLSATMNTIGMVPAPLVTCPGQ
jgi:5-methylthioadenosine/S-adenosylhomocysteine deaminase